MLNKFDEMTKGLAQSVTRRQALRRVGVGLAGVALAMFGANNAEAGHCPPQCHRYRGVCYCPPRMSDEDGGVSETSLTGPESSQGHCPPSCHLYHGVCYCPPRI